MGSKIYIYGNEFCDLLNQIKEILSGCLAHHLCDSENNREIYQNYRSRLLTTLGLLMDSNESKNLDSYFHRYLHLDFGQLSRPRQLI